MIEVQAEKLSLSISSLLGQGNTQATDSLPVTTAHANSQPTTISSQLPATAALQNLLCQSLQGTWILSEYSGLKMTAGQRTMTG